MQERPVHRGNFRDLIVWQKAVQLTTAIYRCTESFPKDERFGLIAQVRRAAVSVPSNIAEGAGRSSSREYRHLLAIARGSNMELQTQLVIAVELGFGTKNELEHAEALSIEVGRMLAALMRHLTPKTAPSSTQDS